MPEQVETCPICGSALEAPPLCPDCASNPVLCAEHVRLRKDWIDGLKADQAVWGDRLKAHLATPQSKRLGRFRVNWRRFTSNRLDIKTFRAQEPAVYSQYSYETEIDQLYCDLVED